MGKKCGLDKKALTKRLEDLFKQSSTSDCSILLGNGVELKLHKNVLSAGSEFLSEKLKNENEIKFEEEEKISKQYFEFLYTGNIEFTDEEKIIDFLLLAVKYKTKNLSELKIASKKLLKKLIDFAEKEVENLEVFEKLLLSVDFKKMDEDDLEKLMKKSKDKWLKKNSVWKKQMKTVGQDDKSGSDESKDSNSDSDSEKESESEEEETELKCTQL
jgi:hypothetical protein